MSLNAPKDILKHFRLAYDNAQRILQDSQGPKVFRNRAKVTMSQGPVEIQRSAFKALPLTYRSVDYNDTNTDVLKKAIIVQMIFDQALKPVDGGECYKSLIDNSILSNMTLFCSQTALKVKAQECTKKLAELGFNYKS